MLSIEHTAFTDECMRVVEEIADGQVFKIILGYKAAPYFYPLRMQGDCMKGF